MDNRKVNAIISDQNEGINTVNVTTETTPKLDKVIDTKQKVRWKDSENKALSSTQKSDKLSIVNTSVLTDDKTPKSAKSVMSKISNVTKTTDRSSSQLNTSITLTPKNKKNMNSEEVSDLRKKVDVLDRSLLATDAVMYSMNKSSLPAVNPLTGEKLETEQ